MRNYELCKGLSVMNIKIKKEGKYLFLVYSPNEGVDWLKDKNNHFIKKVFKNKNSIVDTEENNVKIKFGELEGNFFKIDKEVLDINIDLFFHKNIKVAVKYFIAAENISIFKYIDEIIKENILYIGGNGKSNTISKEKFDEIIESFPNSYRVRLYRESRIYSSLVDLVETTKNYDEKYEKYIQKKSNLKNINLSKKYAEYEVDKYTDILKRLKLMLDNSIQYSESNWQDEIISIIKLIYPKYIVVLKEVPITDPYFREGVGKSRTGKKRIDIVLIDVNGNIDIIEIKKPESEDKTGILTSSPNEADNYTPTTNLTYPIMQMEKYIFFLNKLGKTWEDTLTKKYKSDLPKDFNIKITNPSGIVIAGRSYSMSPEKKKDFEIIKRKYNNVIDVLTYDDIIERLENTIQMVTTNQN